MSGERDDPEDSDRRDGSNPDPDAADPFEAFDREYADREGDPFERLDAPDHDRGVGGPDAPPGATDEPADATPEGQSDGRQGPDGTRGDSEAADPFEYGDDQGQEGSAGGRAGQSGRRGGRQSTDDAERREVNVRAGDPLSDVEVSGEDPFESGASAFEDAGVEGVDPDEVWERLTGEGEAARAHPAEEDEDVVEVSKHAFCEGCEHFSPPPNVDCTHEGTDILEFTGLETVRVVNCPVVAERRELGGLDE